MARDPVIINRPYHTVAELNDIALACSQTTDSFDDAMIQMLISLKVPRMEA